MSGFVHLHAHTVWSLRDGAIPAEVLPHFAKDQGYEAIAMTDHDSLTGAVRFTKACRSAGIKPIYGVELTVRREPPEDARPERRLKNGVEERSGGRPEAAGTNWNGLDHVTVIAKNATGYANLCRLISDAHLSHERDRPETTRTKIAERAEGLFVLSGCSRGEVARKANAGDIPGAIEAAKRWRDEIGPGYRLEVFDHRGYGHRMLRDRLLAVARESNTRPVATNDVHYATPRYAGVHELLHSIKEIVPLSRTHALRPNSEYYLKDPAEMRALFADAPEAADETRRIADECDFELDLGTYHFPDFELPEGDLPEWVLERRCYEGVYRRFDRITNEVEDRLQHELRMINKLGWPSYFLMVADIVDHVKTKLGIRCACRGSAAGSLVCYLLGISDVDPVRYDLLFERFMNTRREELPDIDVDVESHRREEVLAHVLDTYGADQTAMCCMVDTFRARMAIREVGKALGLPPEEIDLVAKAFPRVRASDIPQAIQRLPELANSNLDAGQLEQLFRLCIEIDGFPRHLALHPSGVILSANDLADRVPMQESFGGFTMLQADKDDVEELGLVKLDVLGVRMLSSIAHAVAEIKRARGETIDLDRLPHDDDKTFDLVRSSRTLGCFQIESPGQRELLARFQPGRFEDLIVDISLFRPGPVKSDMVSPFLERRHGFEETRYVHPKLRPILAETNGVVVYHEQVIRVIAAATGCSLDDADYVRRHLDADQPGRVIWEGVAQPIEITPPDSSVESWFKASAVQNGFTRGQADELWKEVFAFASFGFCKAHAAAFALPTYLSTWLKAHYPAEFLAGILTHDPGMYPRRLIVADARHFGTPILPVDVNASHATYRVERAGDKVGIRLALSEVRDITEAEIDSLIEHRPYESLEDLWRKATVSRPVLENLVHLGALDSIKGARTRRELLWRAVDLTTRTPAQKRTRRRKRVAVESPPQLAFDLEEPIAETLPGLPEYSELEETEAELEITGIDARRHMLDLYRPLLAEIGCVPADRLAAQKNDAQVWVAGVKVSSQTPAIRSGQRIIFVTLDDPTGPMDITVFERVQARCARTVFHSWLLLFKGIVRKRGGASRTQRTDPRAVGITVVAQEAFDLAEIAADRKAGHSLAAALGRQRRIQAATGLGPPKPGESRGRRWHSSGGSAGP
ncbi:MAG TPA: DNA polymerase III subunit alpha [Actinomycetota bacterium]|nr:DNA polymerase III subunit alpha [Actinomycetota bacterium]